MDGSLPCSTPWTKVEELTVSKQLQRLKQLEVEVQAPKAKLGKPLEEMMAALKDSDRILRRRGRHSSSSSSQCHPDTQE